MMTGTTQQTISPWQAARVGALWRDLQRIDQRLARLDDVLRDLAYAPVPDGEIPDRTEQARRP